MKTLYDYLTDSARDEGDEITVRDKDYDLEIYFYPDSMKSKEEWDKAMTAVAKKLTVISEGEDGVTVDLADVIEKNLDNGKFDYLFRVFRYKKGYTYPNLRSVVLISIFMHLHINRVEYLTKLSGLTFNGSDEQSLWRMLEIADFCAFIPHVVLLNKSLTVE